ncbi:MAG TPA: ATP-binding protein [Thermoleophilaceae bacterium]|nr:ATP-binding protein [Thermoleophilaceae bacterium]
MHEEIVRPNAAAMIESMRAFGYSTQAAIADLVDNSISAGARNVWIDFHWAGRESYVCMVDDGVGMSERELSAAMRLGSRSPREARIAGDLGRFGLGLKTASFSQCRSLTVASRRSASPAVVRRWDLDHVNRTEEWTLLTNAEPHALRRIEALDELDQGTAVLWEKGDRLVGDDALEDRDAHDRFLGNVRHVEEHLAMTFQRFMTGRDATVLWINGRRLEPWDPFLEQHPATQRLPEEVLAIRGERIVVAPFVLPHHSRLTGAEHARAAGPGGWNAYQGFYIYRGGRLLVPGDWLRLFQKEEHAKLARIRIDLPTTVDSEWQIDVRKASARPPGALRADMRRIGEVARRRATAVYRHRGKAIARRATGEHVFVWRQELRRGKLSYAINRGHPVIADLLERDPDAESALRVVEETIPAPLIALDASQRPDQQASPFEMADAGELRGLLRKVYSSLRRVGGDRQGILEQLMRMEPFDGHPEILAELDDLE